METFSRLKIIKTFVILLFSFASLGAKEDTSIVLVNASNHVSIVLEKGKPLIKTYHTEQYRLTSDRAANFFNEDKISYSGFERIKKIKAYSINAEGKKIKVKDFRTRDKLETGNIFHSDMKEISFIYHGLEKGSNRFLKYESVENNFKLPLTFMFQSYYKCLQKDFSILVDSNIHLDINLFGDTKENIKFSKSNIKNKTLYKWEVKNPNRFKVDRGAPNLRYFVDHLVIQIDYFIDKQGNKIDVLGSPKELYDTYVPNIRKVLDAEPSEELIKISDSLCKNKTEEFEKVKAIYYWVQENIKYIAFEAGSGGFIPRPSNLVCDRKYGDCKDMASLIFTMLRTQDIKSRLTWVGSRDIPYKYDELASFITDNHMICMYEAQDGKTYVLDATSSFQPIDLPTSFIQGKQALMDNGEGTGFDIYNIPEVPAASSVYRDTIWAEISDKGVLKGRGTIEATGYYSIMVNNIYDFDDEEKLIKRFESVNPKGNNACKILSAEFLNKKDRHLSPKVNYTFETPNYITQLDDEIYVSLFLDKNGIHPEFEEDRENEYENDNRALDDYVIKFKIPEGYSASFIPENKTYGNDKFKYEISYAEENEFITCNVKLHSNYMYIKPKEFDEWNKYCKSLKKAAGQSILLKKTKQ